MKINVCVKVEPNLIINKIFVKTFVMRHYVKFGKKQNVFQLVQQNKHALPENVNVFLPYQIILVLLSANYLIVFFY